MLLAIASASGVEVPSAKVASFTERRGEPPPTYQLLSSWHGLTVAAPTAASAMTVIDEALQQRGYRSADRFLSSDVVVIARFGLSRHFPDVDAVLAGADPAEELPDGKLFVRVEAYDLDRYAAFLETAGRDAATGAELGFLVWETAAEMNTDVHSATDFLLKLTQVAARHLDSETRQLESSLPAS